MTKKNIKKPLSLTQWLVILKIIVVILCVDILIKEYVYRNQISTNNGIIDITFATNTGTMWSLFSNVASSNLIFIILSFIALGFLFYYLSTEHKHFAPVSVIIAGVLGNLSDRIHYGFVIDWANLHFWPIFNVADVAIVSGVIWLIYLLLKEEVKKT